MGGTDTTQARRDYAMGLNELTCCTCAITAGPDDIWTAFAVFKEA